MSSHTFEPTQFHLTLGSHAPVLRINDGDTVRTWCVDAGGNDRDFRPITPGGNPQTGPFYVEGAEPGDSLAVHLDRLWPNRNRAHSSTRVVANIVDPEFVPTLPREHVQGVWEIDRERGTATLVEPESKLGG